MPDAPASASSGSSQPYDFFDDELRESLHVQEQPHDIFCQFTDAAADQRIDGKPHFLGRGFSAGWVHAFSY
ncbi:hypothetical protein PR003_g33097 [Phytophthora rubi]|uniref:Uncharacterized protein n=1 Tax=Phytophthora rubi TaxID=129364 RepID=A0A6A3GDN1_9STRA|nr:hypothetical protein PR002_g31731 [Phytophthora rubi]KAE9263614.1 hypothetical protein PR003_g33097 [Phytophthora rubi]